MFNFRNRNFLNKRKKQPKPILGYTKSNFDEDEYERKQRRDRREYEESLVQPYIWIAESDESVHLVDDIGSATDAFEYLQSIPNSEPACEQQSDSTSEYNTPETTYNDSSSTYNSGSTFESYNSGSSSSYDGGSSCGGE